MSLARIVIVGAGHAAVSAAATLRKDGFTGEVTLLGAEGLLPYDRPSLSKGFLHPGDGSALLHDAAWYEQHAIAIERNSAAVGIDIAEQQVITDDGRRYRYDRLLLATGSSPRQLRVPGSHADGVHYLRTLTDARALRAELEPGDRRVVIIGSGWIGLEVAASARMLGNSVTILQRGPVPLATAIGSELGAMFAALHREHDVSLRGPVDVVALESRAGRVTGVALFKSEVVPADVVVVGIGAIPNVSVASLAGIDVDDGIVTDERLAASAPGVYAAGDVANAFHPMVGRRLRNDHWATALTSGAHAARAMLGDTAPYDAIPYFYTDQFDLSMEYAGFAHLTRNSAPVYRGNTAECRFIAFWLQDRVVVAGMNVNVPGVSDTIQALIRSRRAVDPERLQDPAFPLEEL